MAKLSAAATASNISTLARRARARAESGCMAMAAVARASAVVHDGATTVADNTDVCTGIPVMGLMMCPACVPSASVR